MFNFFLLKKIERRSRCHKLSAFTATGDGIKFEPRARRRVRKSGLVHGCESVCKS